MTAYNLLDEKWVQVKTLDDTIEKCSIRDVIKNAHTYKEFMVERFNDIEFVLYEYLLIRFFSTLVATVTHINESNQFDIFSNGSFDLDLFNRYFEKWYDRFDIFHPETPFMQTFEKDLVSLPTYNKLKDGSDGGMLICNPSSVASSGRIYSTGIKPEIFKNNINDLDNPIYVLRRSDSPKKIKDAIVKSSPITIENFVYILLYTASIAPGVGAGYKAGVAGNSYYYETLTGDNLFETLVLNAPTYDEEDDFNHPIWEWDSSFSIFNIGDIGLGRIGHIGGMFIPCRIIRGYATDNIISKLIFCSFKSAEVPYNKLIDACRQDWGLNREPHAVHKRLVNIKDDTTNPYASLGIGDETWLLLIGESRIPSNEILFNRQKYLESIGDKYLDIMPYARTITDRSLIRNRCGLTIYYRICDDKWVYLKSGKLSGIIDKKIVDLPELNQEYLLCLAQYIKDASRLLSRPDFTNKGPKTGVNKKAEDIGVDKIFLNKLSGFFGVYGNKNSYIQQIANCTNEDELKKVYQKGVNTVMRVALDVFDLLYDKNDLVNFWKTKNLVSSVLRKKGKALD